MDYYPQTLQNVIDTMTKIKGKFSICDFQSTMAQLFGGLDYIHSSRFTHRDIKPDNLLVNMTERKLVIADFGSAKCVTNGSYNKSVPSL